jgi:UDP-glucose 4-epimerase
MRILVTGGAGYLGANLVEMFLDLDEVETVIVYDNFSRKCFSVLSLLNDIHQSKLEIQCSDLLDNKSLHQTVQSVDVIIHLAAVCRTPFNDENPQFFDQVNHWGTAALVGELDKIKTSKKVLFASSGSIYGRTDSEATTTTIPHPVTSYARSKLAGETQVRRLKGKHSVAIYRFGNVFGIGKSMRFDAVINKFFLESIFSKPLKVEGDGTQRRPFVPLNSAISMIKKYVFEDFQGVFNINTHNWSINEILDGYQNVFNQTEIIHINQNEVLGGLNMTPSQLVLDSQTEFMNKSFNYYLNSMVDEFKVVNCGL